MPADIPGIHHVTAIGSDPRRNLEFYTETLGLRLVKRSVNQDDVSVYHLFYGDHSGSPGTSMTFFPYTDARPGQVGTGQASAVAFLIPDGAVEFWTDRLADAGVDAEEPTERFGDTVISFEDPDGLPLEFVARSDAPAGDPPEGPVPDEHAIRGFFGVTLSLATAGPTAEVLQTMGYSETDADGSRQRYESDGDLGYVVDICEKPQAPVDSPVPAPSTTWRFERPPTTSPSGATCSRGRDSGRPRSSTASGSSRSTSANTAGSSSSSPRRNRGTRSTKTSSRSASASSSPSGWKTDVMRSKPDCQSCLRSNDSSGSPSPSVDGLTAARLRGRRRRKRFSGALV